MKRYFRLLIIATIAIAACVAGACAVYQPYTPPPPASSTGGNR